MAASSSSFLIIERSVSDGSVDSAFGVGGG